MRFVLAYLVGMSIFISGICQAKLLVTNPDRSDGFGAQFQTIIYSVIFAELNNAEFVYTPFKTIEHNYDNDPAFNEKKESLINFKNNFEINDGQAFRLNTTDVINFFERNLSACANSASLEKIKKIFKSNKNKNNYFEPEYFHIAVHIRRHNAHDNRIDGTNTPDEVFIAIIDCLRKLLNTQKPLFHIYSQGDANNFKKFDAQDIIFHLNESVEDTFSSLVLADALVTSRSSFSYTAAILSEGAVYYIPFWHPPLPHWIPINLLLVK